MTCYYTPFSEDDIDDKDLYGEQQQLILVVESVNTGHLGLPRL